MTPADHDLLQVKMELKKFSEASGRKFHVLFNDTAVLRDDLHSIKRLMTEHGLRLAKLEKGKIAE